MAIAPNDTIPKAADAAMVVEFDWTSELTGPDGAGTETISSSTFAFVDPLSDGLLTKDNPSIVSGSLETRVRVSGGTPGQKYGLANTVVTNGSPAQTYKQMVYVQLLERP
jgi:hypothetical protein